VFAVCPLCQRKICIETPKGIAISFSKDSDPARGYAQLMRRSAYRHCVAFEVRLQQWKIDDGGCDLVDAVGMLVGHYSDDFAPIVFIG